MRLFEKSTYLQEWSLVKSWIAATLVLKNALNLEDSVCIQASTIEAVNNIISFMVQFLSEKLAKLVTGQCCTNFKTWH